jgi:hypothetical protein
MCRKFPKKLKKIVVTNSKIFESIDYDFVAFQIYAHLKYTERIAFIKQLLYNTCNYDRLIATQICLVNRFFSN